MALAAGLALAACGGGGSPATSSPPPAAAPPENSAVVALDASNFDAVVGADGVCLIEFYHPTCSHCRAMAPVVEQLATDFQGRAVVAKVNVTTDRALAAAWGVRGYPTFVVVKDGRQYDVWLGETSYDRLAGMIRAALGAP